MTAFDLDQWFVRDVLPLEAALVRFLRRNWRDASEIADLRQEVYARVYDAAVSAIPAQTQAFVLMTARNLIIDRVRRSQIVSIELVSDLEALNVSADEVTPDRVASAREELRRLQAALETLPPRCREVVVLRRIECLSQREVAARMGIVEDTVERQLANGMKALADALYGHEAGPSEVAPASTTTEKANG